MTLFIPRWLWGTEATLRHSLCMKKLEEVVLCPVWLSPLSTAEWMALPPPNWGKNCNRVWQAWGRKWDQVESHPSSDTARTAVELLLLWASVSPSAPWGGYAGTLLQSSAESVCGQHQPQDRQLSPQANWFGAALPRDMPTEETHLP